jgi:peptidoglycan/LPS O-acetylase OafA/YrhL
LLCIAKLRTGIRSIFLAGIVCYTLWMGRWDLFLFLSGTFLCEIQFIRLSWSESSERALPTQSSNNLTTETRFGLSQITVSGLRNCTTLVHALPLMGFMFSLYILSFPDESPEKSPGYINMIAYTPAHYVVLGLVNRFWLAIGAFICVLSINFSPFLQGVFNTRLAQYLGKISFALYIVHGPILYTIGVRMLHLARAHRDADVTLYGADAGDLKYFMTSLLAFTVDTILCVCIADLFWRQVDAKSVAFAGWVVKKCWKSE